jgi:hypothetical protein
MSLFDWPHDLIVKMVMTGSPRGGVLDQGRVGRDAAVGTEVCYVGLSGPSLGLIRLVLTAQSCRSPVVGHSALQPVRPDFRCDREISAQVNSQFADKAAVCQFSGMIRFRL